MSFVWELLRFWIRCFSEGKSIGSIPYNIIVGIVGATGVAYLWWTKRKPSSAAITWPAVIVKWATVLLVIPCGVSIFIVAPFLQYRQEHQAAAACREERDKPRPKLDVQLLSVMSAETLYRGNPPTPQFSVIVNLAVKNFGAPSVVQGYQLTLLSTNLIATNQHRVNAAQTLIPLDGIAAEGTLVLQTNDAIYEKTSEHPVVQGAQVVGSSCYIVFGYKREVLWTNGTIAEITVFDILGNRYVGSLPISGGKGELLWYPGLSRPRRVPTPFR